MNTTPGIAPPPDAAGPSIWHTLSVEEASQTLRVTPDQGLSQAEVTTRRAEYGPNLLREKPPRSLLATLIDQFKSVLILILIGAAGLAWAIGDLKDALVILVVTMINAFLGLYQEYRAERSLGALKRMLAVKARVRRGGVSQDIAADDLVPGDVVLLEAGGKIPADGRLLISESLEVDESSLTGESHAVAKKAKEVLDADAALGERINSAFMNSMVTRGRGEMVVTATGMGTETGKLAEALSQTEEPPTPLQQQLDKLGKRLALVACVFVVAILGLRLVSGTLWADALLEAIALAVAAIPEGLPAVVTVTLAIGMQRMARNRAIVKRLAAVETLGSTTVICSDKTGTLTLNQMTVRALCYQGHRYGVSGEGYRANGQIHDGDGQGLPELQPLLLPLALCNDSRVRNGQVLGDPMEGALWILAEKGGLDPDQAIAAYPRIAEVPFDAEHKFMATFHRDGDSVLLMMKGAPEAVFSRSSEVSASGGRTERFDDAAGQRLGIENRYLAEQQLRVLAVASRRLPAAGFDTHGDLWPHLRQLTLIGLVGLADAPRPEVKSAIARCHEAGIEVKMITGDQRDTALAIGRELGLGTNVIVGAELERMSPAELSERVEGTSVYARVTPAHKMRIVDALQARGHIVAVTGDGVNDAPALKKAHIGVAMGNSGTEVAKEAATMVLTDDNFATIVGAVSEGRTIYSNIVKFVRYQLSTNIGALLSMLTASLFGWPAPFNPIQILWVNIIMDGPPAMAMGLDPARPEVMKDKPRSAGEEILSWRRLGLLMMFGSIMTAGTLSMMLYGLAAEPGNPTYGLTLAFNTFVLFQIFNAHNARVERGTVFTRRLLTNPALWLSLAGVGMLQVVAVQWQPAETIFRTQALSGSDWALCLAVSATILVYGELHRAVRWMLEGDRRIKSRPNAP